MSTYQPMPGRLGIADLLRELVEQTTSLIRQEIQLVKAEGKQGIQNMVFVGVLGMLALHFAALCTLFLGLSLVLLLFVQGMGVLWAALITAGASLVLSLLFLGVAFIKLRKDYPHWFGGHRKEGKGFERKTEKAPLLMDSAEG